MSETDETREGKASIPSVPSRSYHARRSTLGATMRDFVELYRGTAKMKREIPDRVRTGIERCASAEQDMARVLGRPVRDLDMLEIGPGLLPRQLVYFAQGNRASGIDLDVIAEGVGPISFLRIARRNGPKRTLKTSARRLIGVDRRFRREVSSQFRIDR